MKSIAIVVLLTLIAIKAVDLAFLSYLSYDEFLFPPNSRAAYKTREFDTLVSINRFGFRGDETEIAEGQILAIGDSFTYGWGLNGDEVWARLLENRLKSSGLDLKVYNLGVPGTDTSFHLEVADRYIRQLKPKFVVVSVLMGDDFAQVLASKFSKSVWSAILKAAKSNAIRLFPGLHKFYVHARYFNFGPHVRDSSYSRYSRSQAVLSITKDWAEESLRVIRDKKLDLPDDILAHAAAGDINPGLLQTPAAAAAPSRSRESLDKIEKVRRKVLVELTNRFSDIGSLARRHGGRLIIFGMPNGAFVNSAVTANYRKYGMSVTDVDLVTREPEAILQQMARNSDALFVPSLSEFREHRGTELFFPLDGHLTPEGSRLVAKIIGNALLGGPGNR